MNKIIVVCNVEHDITPGVCAFCERDKAVQELRLLSEQIENLATWIRRQA